MDEAIELGVCTITEAEDIRGWEVRIQPRYAGVFEEPGREIDGTSPGRLGWIVFPSYAEAAACAAALEPLVREAYDAEGVRQRATWAALRLIQDTLRRVSAIEDDEDDETAAPEVGSGN